MAPVKINPLFLTSLRDPRIERFVRDFERWNDIALPIMNRVSIPYISVQRELARAMRKKVGEVILDYGCGSGSITAYLLEDGNPISTVIALDPDHDVLEEVPETLQRVGFRGEIKLILSSSMVDLPIDSESLDTIVSGLGGVIYSGFHLNSSKQVIEGKEALNACLEECRRVLKPGGFLGFSSLVPDPNFKAIKWQSIWALTKGLRVASLIVALRHAQKIERASRFMKECAKVSYVHYLHGHEWQEILEKKGFKVDTLKTGSYAGQGIVIVANRL